MTTPAFTWPDIFSPLVERRPLPAAATRWAMAEIMAGEATSAQVAAFGALLHAKGETPAELTGLVEEMRSRAPRVPITEIVVDVVGTGGDRAETVNISTMAALVVAGSGRPVVKHGNRAASSRAGTADVLEQLGVAIGLDAAGVAASLAAVGIGFCFAPVFHAGLRHAAAPRRELGVPTVFNLLGPLTNPARPQAAAIGCFDLAMAPVMGAVLAARGDTAFVVRGDDGLDELTTTTTTQVWFAVGGTLHRTTVDPSRFGIAAVAPAALRGGDAVHNATVLRTVLAGGEPAVADVVALNAAAGIAAYDVATGVADASIGSASAAQALVEDLLAAGLAVARTTLASGAAADVLQRWTTFRV